MNQKELEEQIEKIKRVYYDENKGLNGDNYFTKEEFNKMVDSPIAKIVFKLTSTLHADDYTLIKNISNQEIFDAIAIFSATIIVGTIKSDKDNRDLIDIGISYFIREFCKQAIIVKGHDDLDLETVCDHKGTLEDYVLNEGYWFCTKCKDKIKKHVRKD